MLLARRGSPWCQHSEMCHHGPDAVRGAFPAPLLSLTVGPRTSTTAGSARFLNGELRGQAPHPAGGALVSRRTGWCVDASGGRIRSG